MSQYLNKYLPQDFHDLLESIYQQLGSLTHSENYQELITSVYSQGLEVNLSDALQAIQEVKDAFIEKQTDQGV